MTNMYTPIIEAMPLDESAGALPGSPILRSGSHAPEIHVVDAASLPSGFIPVTGAKNPNPKDSIGSSKVPLHLWPMEASVLGALGLLDGAHKYGRSNFLVAPVRASIYFDAASRHLGKWFAGEDCDGDDAQPGDEDQGSGISHLGHVLACIAILVSAKSAGTLIDDRMVKNGLCRFIRDYTPEVKRIQAMHAGKTPHHYTIADNEPTP